jgi:hypothetical protein
MKPNPYEPFATLEHTPSFAIPIGSFEEIRENSEAAFVSRGFEVAANFRTGPYIANLRCTMRGRSLPILYTDRIYIHELDRTIDPTTSLVCDIHAHDVADAETFHSPWLRFRIPCTATYILHHRPISKEANEFFRTTRLPKQTNRPHAIFFLNLVNGKTCFYVQTALLKSVNISRATQTFQWYVDTLCRAQQGFQEL